MQMQSIIRCGLECLLPGIKGTPKEAARKLAKYDVISFDVFDTLIFRPFSKPEELFRLVGDETGRPDFMELRKKAEQDARRELFRNSRTYEVTLDEIYQYMEKEAAIPENIKQIELRMEKQYCFANPYMKSITEELKDTGKKLVATSDMYLGRREIERILEGAGYEKFDAVYVSSEQRKSKAAGDLFDYIKEQHGEGKCYVHVGDNYHSDVRMAKKHGFRTFYYKV